MDFSKIGQAAAEAVNLTVDKKFEKVLPRAGVTLLRLREYVETGRHQPKNAAHKPALKCHLIFELCHKDHMTEFDGVMKHGEIKVRLNIGITAKAGYRKLFKVMNAACGNKFQHFAQMLGQPFLATMYHSVPTNVGDTVYANLDLDGAWSMVAPTFEDPITGVVQAVPVPEMQGKARAFLWECDGVTDDDIRNMWAALYNADTYEKDGVVMSKNWDQEELMKNLEWDKSRTRSLVTEEVVLDDHIVDEAAVASGGIVNDPLAAAAGGETVNLEF